jgi:hypothetical protein
LLDRLIAATAEAFAGAPDLPGRLSATDAEVLERLYLRVEVAVKGRVRDGQADLLSWLSRTIPDEDIPNCRVEVSGVGTVRGDQIRLRKPVSIDACDGILVLGSALAKMHGWLDELIVSGQVEP